MAAMIPSVPQSVRTVARRTGRVARKTAIWTLIGVGVLIVLLVLALLYVAFVGVTVSAAPWRDTSRRRRARRCAVRWCWRGRY